MWYNGHNIIAAVNVMIIVVQRHSTILEGVLGVGELVLDLVLVELHVDVVVPGQGVTRLLFLLLTE